MALFANVFRCEGNLDGSVRIMLANGFTNEAVADIVVPMVVAKQAAILLLKGVRVYEDINGKIPMNDTIKAWAEESGVAPEDW